MNTAPRLLFVPGAPTATHPLPMATLSPNPLSDELILSCAQLIFSTNVPSSPLTKDNNVSTPGAVVAMLKPSALTLNAAPVCQLAATPLLDMKLLESYELFLLYTAHLSLASPSTQTFSLFPHPYGGVVVAIRLGVEYFTLTSLCTDKNKLAVSSISKANSITNLLGAGTLDTLYTPLRSSSPFITR